MVAGVASDLNTNRISILGNSRSTATDGAVVGAAVGAAVMAAGLALDLTNDKSWSPDRDAIVLRLVPAQSAPAVGGAR